MTPRLDWIYGAGALAFVAAAIYHVVATLIPSFGAVAYPSGYPVWRHVLFIAINVSMAWLLFGGVRWVIWPIALLTVQIYYGHGRHAWVVWRDEARIEWIDLLAAFGATLLLVFLVAARPQDGARLS